jgi:hypothetical protein
MLPPRLPISRSDLDALALLGAVLGTMLLQPRWRSLGVLQCMLAVPIPAVIAAILFENGSLAFLGGLFIPLLFLHRRTPRPSGGLLQDAGVVASTGIAVTTIVCGLLVALIPDLRFYSVEMIQRFGNAGIVAFALAIVVWWMFRLLGRAEEEKVRASTADPFPRTWAQKCKYGIACGLAFYFWVSLTRWWVFECLYFGYFFRTLVAHVNWRFAWAWADSSSFEGSVFLFASSLFTAFQYKRSRPGAGRLFCSLIANVLVSFLFDVWWNNDRISVKGYSYYLTWWPFFRVDGSYFHEWPQG